MNDNVGDMPIEIFGDYISDTLGEEWSWEYFQIFNGYYQLWQVYRIQGYNGFGCGMALNGFTTEYRRLLWLWLLSVN